MICPQCGSRDVDDQRVADEKLILAECNRCGHQWEESYEPDSKGEYYDGREINMS